MWINQQHMHWEKQETKTDVKVQQANHSTLVGSLTFLSEAS